VHDVDLTPDGERNLRAVRGNGRSLPYGSDVSFLIPDPSAFAATIQPPGSATTTPLTMAATPAGAVGDLCAVESPHAAPIVATSTTIARATWRTRIPDAPPCDLRPILPRGEAGRMVAPTEFAVREGTHSPLFRFATPSRLRAARVSPTYEVPNSYRRPNSARAERTPVNRSLRRTKRAQPFEGPFRRPRSSRASMRRSHSSYTG
jgi:hypothetical protein